MGGTMTNQHSPALARRGVLALGLTAGVGVLGARSAAAATSVGYSYQRQQTQSWCSAASSRIALTAKGRTPTQASLASSLGLSGGSGLQDPYAIARVLNARLGIADNARRYRFRQPAAGTLKATLHTHVRTSIDAGYPVVINMNQVNGDVYSAGHYIAIVGYRAGDYKIADPDEPARNGVWRTEDNIVAWNKLNRYSSFGG